MITKVMEFVGVSPLVMNNAQKANPLNEKTKAFRSASKVRGKTEEQVEELARLEWECGLYYDEKLGPVVPAENLRQCLREGATRFRKGRDFESGLMISDSEVKLEYKGPREIQAMWISGKFHDSRMAGNGGQGKNKKKVLRTRPLFREWKLRFEVELEDVDESDVLHAAEIAGRKIGLCEKHFGWGRFAPKWAD